MEKAKGWGLRGRGWILMSENTLQEVGECIERESSSKCPSAISR